MKNCHKYTFSSCKKAQKSVKVPYATIHVKMWDYFPYNQLVLCLKSINTRNSHKMLPPTSIFPSKALDQQLHEKTTKFDVVRKSLIVLDTSAIRVCCLQYRIQRS
uniref:Uncharacterized protein n=1 Tax=Opuntia streptacantha TaxID=393608 RepID=A0A7C8YIJ3_OPUST